jgi:hypothetical protein
MNKTRLRAEDRPVMNCLSSSTGLTSIVSTDRLMRVGSGGRAVARQDADFSPDLCYHRIVATEIGLVAMNGGARMEFLR